MKMKIRYANVTVRIGAPFNEILSKSFAVKGEGNYKSQGIKIGRILIIDFVENHFPKPTPEDYRYVENLSKITVTRFTI